ncbi:LOW QUALITY PROTEIN: b(0,+)-type amino acid transporter 1 [Rhincodon typus]|uniref:LOW QUALITY PROTEIN: b(0,+)-type amino acid transporter 1 n=1 Tax=Rhincodon typus TaxID=259920 RepID=UPI0009A337B6|nr:LOW QUALITY PROTEIN: b(0,+)-type amino acid transporter 1 [Rhincodon typus]
MDASTRKLHLKREVGLISAVCLIVGTMIGSGIYMSPEWVLQYIGSPGASLVVWTVCGLVCTIAALAYVELGSAIKESGGEYIYILKKFGPIPAFLFSWTSVFIARPAGIAAMSLSLAQYIAAPFYDACLPPSFVVKCTAAASILLLGIINGLNVKLATRIQNIFTFAKLLSLLIIVIGGIVLLFKGHMRSFQNAFQGTMAGFGSMGIAFQQGMWSYGGWNNLNYVTEEIRRPEVNLPRAILISLPLVTLLYLMVNISYLAAMNPTEMMASGAVAVTWGNRVLGSWAWLMPLSVVLSTFGSVSGSFFTGGRSCYVAAREGSLPDILSMAHVHRLTPLPALLFTALIALIMLIPGDFGSIVNYFSFTAWMFYSLTFAALINMKIKRPHLHQPFKVPMLVPIFMLIISAYLVVAPIVGDPRIEYLFVFLFMLCGLLIYFPLIHFKLWAGSLGQVTVFLQLLLEVAPTQANLD